MEGTSRLKLLLLTLLLIYSPLLSPAQSYHKYDENETVDFILQSMEKMGIEHRVQDLLETERPSAVPNIRASIPGTGNREGRIIFAVPIHPDNRYAVEAALALAGEAARAPGEKSLELLFLGGEYPPPNNSDAFQLPQEDPQPGPDALGFQPRGSRAFLKDFFPEEETAFIYLQLSSPPKELELFPSGSGVPSPSWLVRLCVEGVKGAKIPYRLDSLRSRLYRAGLQNRPSPIDPFLEASFPAILIRGIGEQEASPILDPRAIEGFLAKLLNGAPLPDYMDRHYLIIKPFSRLLIVSEQHYILLLLAIFAMASAYPVFAVSRFKKYLKTLWRHLWSLPLIICILFLFLFAAGVLIEQIQSYLGIDRLWEYRPYTLLVFKLSTAAFLFILSQRLFRLLPFSRRGSFYSASALFFFLAALITISLFDIGLTYYIIFSFIMVFLFTTSRNRYLKVLYFLLASLPMALELYSLFQLPALRPIRFLLVSPVKGNLFVALNFLPFLLMIIRLQYLFHHPSKRITKAFIIGIELSLLSTALISSGILIQSDIFSGKEQPLYIRHHLDAREDSRSILLYSPAPLGDLLEEEKKIKANRYEYSIKDPSEPLQLELTSSTFLSRRSYRLRIEAEKPLSRIFVKLKSSEPFTLLDASRNWRLEADQKQAQFLIEQQPDLPYHLDFTIPESFRGELILQARFAESPKRYHLGEQAEKFRILEHYVYENSLRIE